MQSEPISATIRVDTTKPGIRVSRTLYGIFFEEVNCAGDGGLYAEMVRNRSFEDSEKPEHWSFQPGGAEVSVDTSKPLSQSNHRSLRIGLPPSGKVEIINEGYWGIAARKGDEYKFSIYARCDDTAAPVEVLLRGDEGTTIAHSTIRGITKEWRLFRATLKPTANATRGRLVIAASGHGSVWLDMVSLFPKRTWNSRSNGLRTDLADMLLELRPAFVRFPGGCWVEGDTMATSQRWKRTVGDLVDRRTQYNLWQYMSTNGLGYHEYLQMCEDLGAEPLFVINCGMSHKENVPMDNMDEFVQDALDAIEYANGPPTSKWGALRAKNGNPKPFGLKYMEIGNENGGPAYHERYPLFYKAIKERYPTMHLIANVWGGYPDANVDIVDEHYYSSPQFFIDNAARYDKYDRKGPKVYVGEYAVTQGCGEGNLIAAIGEAAFMTGMERNSDVVIMSSYAPLFANINHKTWNPDLIYFDNHRVCGTPSYYVQKLFSENRPDVILPMDISYSSVPKARFSPGGIGVGTWHTQAEFKDIRVVQGADVLYESADGSSLTRGPGGWSSQDGALRQTTDAEPSRAFHTLHGSTNYSITLKARKNGGAEGFLITVGMEDDQNYLWWNLGGWGNTKHAIERCVAGAKSIIAEAPGAIESGRWYDIRIEFSGERIRCYLDGKLVHDVECPQITPLYAVAGRVDKTGEVIIKVVNVSGVAVHATIELEGGGDSKSGTQTVLSSESPTDENTIDSPAKLAPHTNKVNLKVPRSEHDFPAYSITIFRVK